MFVQAFAGSVGGFCLTVDESMEHGVQIVWREQLLYVPDR